MFQDLGCDDGGRGILRASVNDAMSDSQHPHAVKTGTKPYCQVVESGAPIGHRRAQMLALERSPRAILCREFRGGADALDLAPSFEAPRVGVSGLVDAELQAR